jgi:hypothetical protein
MRGSRLLDRARSAPHPFADLRYAVFFAGGGVGAIAWRRVSGAPVEVDPPVVQARQADEPVGTRGGQVGITLSVR